MNSVCREVKDSIQFWGSMYLDENNLPGVIYSLNLECADVVSHYRGDGHGEPYFQTFSGFNSAETMSRRLRGRSDRVCESNMNDFVSTKVTNDFREFIKEKASGRCKKSFDKWVVEFEWLGGA
jgi:hypothetical protein